MSILCLNFELRLPLRFISREVMVLERGGMMWLGEKAKDECCVVKRIRCVRPKRTIS